MYIHLAIFAAIFPFNNSIPTFHSFNMYMRDIECQIIFIYITELHYYYTGGFGTLRFGFNPLFIMDSVSRVETDSSLMPNLRTF